MLISFLIEDSLEELKVAYATDEQLHTLINLFREDKLGLDYALREGLLLYKNMYIPP